MLQASVPPPEADATPTASTTISSSIAPPLPPPSSHLQGGMTTHAEQPQDTPTTRARSSGMAGPEEKLRTLQLRILNAVRTKDRHKIFEEPVDGDVVEDYYTIIKHPMCFQAMEQKIGNNEYETMKLFQDDLDLIFSNCTYYNDPATIYHKQAVSIRKASHTIIQKEVAAEERRNAPQTYKGTDASLDDEDDDDDMDEGANRLRRRSRRNAPARTGEDSTKSSWEKRGLMKRTKDGGAVFSARTRGSKHGNAVEYAVKPTPPLPGNAVPHMRQVTGAPNWAGQRAFAAQLAANSFRLPHFLEYGPFGSFAPVADGANANVTPEDAVQQHSGTEWADLLESFVKKASLDVPVSKSSPSATDMDVEEAVTAEDVPRKSAVDLELERISTKILELEELQQERLANQGSAPSDKETQLGEEVLTLLTKIADQALLPKDIAPTQPQQLPKAMEQWQVRSNLDASYRGTLPAAPPHAYANPALRQFGVQPPPVSQDPLAVAQTSNAITSSATVNLGHASPPTANQQRPTIRPPPQFMMQQQQLQQPNLAQTPQQAYLAQQYMQQRLVAAQQQQQQQQRPMLPTAFNGQAGQPPNAAQQAQLLQFFRNQQQQQQQQGITPQMTQQQHTLQQLTQQIRQQQLQNPGFLPQYGPTVGRPQQQQGAMTTPRPGMPIPSMFVSPPGMRPGMPMTPQSDLARQQAALFANRMAEIKARQQQMGPRPNGGLPPPPSQSQAPPGTGHPPPTS